MKRKFISFILSAIMVASIVPSTIANAITTNTYDSTLISNSKTSQSLPSRYDSRDLNYISGAKRQGEIGCCWAFATMGALETSIKKNTGESKDFSEIHLAANNGFLGANGGGNGIIAASYFSSWQGPVYEKDAPYPNPAVPSNVKSEYGGTVTNHIQDVIMVDRTKTGQDKIDNVKNNVYKYGSSTVQVSSEAADGNGTIFNYFDAPIDHEILIVGWDDNYSRDNFQYTKPNHDGAFICRNSWGEELGDNGYFYLSYEDQNLLDPSNTLITFDKVESIDNYKDVYAGCFNTNIFNGALAYKDGISETFPLKMISGIGTGIGENEEIAAVGVPSFTSNADCELYYTNNDVSIEDILNPDNKVKSFHLDDAGFHTIKLDNPIVPKDKKNFSFWIRIFHPSQSNIAKSSPSKEFTEKHYEFLFPETIDENPNNISKKAKSPISFIAGRFYTNEKSNIKPGWNLKNNTWYYYNEDGTSKTGWSQIDGSWYYFNNEGKMQTNWIYVNDNWYYLNSNGTMSTGWLNENGTWYYLNNSGAMSTGWINLNGTWYYLSSNGAMNTGWLYTGDAWYYLNSDGSMKTGWIYTGDAWYYLNSNGSMKTGWIFTGYAWYYLNSNGSMATNTVIDGWKLDANGVGSKL